MNKISDVIIKTLISAEPYMLDMHSKSPEHKNNCFELYGFDILIDNQMKPWLLEVNVRPSLSSSSPLDRRIKHTLMCDMMNLIGILPYNKRAYEEEKKKKIPGYNDQTKRNFSKNINDIQDLDHENCFQKLTQEDWLYLFETDEEFYRKGHFARIYPTPDTQKMEYYMNFFEYPRYNNIVV
jgi:tubulin polyglutamylase TTLL4